MWPAVAAVSGRALPSLAIVRHNLMKVNIY